MALRRGQSSRQAVKEQALRYLLPFISVWLAFTVGMLMAFWPNWDLEECLKPSSSTVTTVFHHATIWTNEKKAYVTAMAVLENGRIACTGSYESVKKIAGPETKFVDLSGQFVTPGFMDPHVHVLSGGLSLRTPDLSAVQTVEELKQIIKAECDKAKPKDWVQGIGWNEVTWGGSSPHRAWLDEICPNNPVIMHRMCWHKVVVSTHAATIAGLSDATEDPPGGKIYRDADGFTGLLAESAMDIVKLKIPAPSVETKRKLVQDASKYFLSKGVTMVHDMGAVPTNELEAFENLEAVYRHLADRGELPIRIFAFTPLSGWRRLAGLIAANGSSSPDMHLFWGGLKEFADGSLGAKTALFHKPYLHQAGEPESRGVRTKEKKVLADLVSQADRAGLQVGIHAIGDLAVDDVLDIYNQTALSNGLRRERRIPQHRIEHAQHLSGPEAAVRFAELGVQAVVNPLHLLPDKLVLRSFLGKKRAGHGHSYAFKTLHLAGADLSFSSDFPVVPSDPLLGIYSATHRRSFGESHPFVLEEAVTLNTGLRATTSAAQLAGLQDHLGSLRAGKLADFVVLTSDPLHMTARFGPPTVLATYVGGQLAYDRERDVQPQWEQQ